MSTETRLPRNERPEFRLHTYGAEGISNIELLALHVGHMGVAQRMLAEFGGLYEVSQARKEELTAYPGVGSATVAKLQSAFELGKRVTKETQEDRWQIRSPADAAALVMTDMQGLEQEEMWILVLDTKNRVKYIDKLYKGAVNTLLIRTGEMFTEAIRRRAMSIIIVHNHPSGDPSPSPEDVLSTSEAVKAGKLLDIEVMDHIIVARQRFTSMKERGLGFS